MTAAQPAGGRAFESYAGVSRLTDGEDLLNLALTLDERDFLDVDIAALVAEVVGAELEEGNPSLEAYPLKDPFGADSLRPSAVGHFGLKAGGSWDLSATAGVGSALHSLADLASGGVAYVIGDAYPDLPWSVWQAGGRCRGSAEKEVDADAIRAAGADLVLVDRPNLVSGSAIGAAELAALCHDLEESGAIVVVDESYANYSSPQISVVPLVEEVENLVVLRGFSKAYWLGGLRLGVCFHSRTLNDTIHHVLAPMCAAPLSLRIGAAVWRSGAVNETLQTVVSRRKAELLAALDGTGLECRSSSGPDIPFIFLGPGCDAAARRLHRVGVMVSRHLSWSPDDGGPVERCRLSVPLSRTRLERCMTALRRLGARTTQATESAEI